jgi:transposase
MMYALDPRVHDPIFATIEHLIPEPARHPLGCHRRRAPDRLIMRGLLWRLVTGSSWETIEVLLDHEVSDTTLRARRDEWIDAGVFVKLLAHAFNGYERLIGINLQTLIIDASNQLAPCGGQGTGMDYKHPGRQGYKWCTAVDTNGAIVGFEIDAANRNDYKMLFPLLDQLVERDLVDDDIRVFADRGFNYPSTRDRLATEYGINHFIAPPRQRAGNRIKRSLPGIRWIVEAVNSWLTNYGQLRRNTDRKTEHRHAALCFAITLWYVNRLTNPRTCTYRPIR